MAHNNLKEHEDVMYELHSLYERKNADYGDSLEL